MRSELPEKEKANERPGDDVQKVFEVRDSGGVLRVLRRAGLPGHHLLPMPEHRLCRQAETQVACIAIRARLTC
jgi:hypothetical protein